MTIGLRCPHCGHSISTTYDTRRNKHGTAIRRRRKCRQCEYRWSTIESAAGSPVYGSPSPMSEAPRDGTQILLLVRWSITTARWVEPKWELPDGTLTNNDCLGWWRLPEIEIAKHEKRAAPVKNAAPVREEHDAS